MTKNQTASFNRRIRLPLRAQIAALLVIFVFAVALISFKSSFNVLEQDKIGAIREIQTLKAADFSRDLADRINRARQQMRETSLRILDPERGVVKIDPKLWRWIRVEGKSWVSSQYRRSAMLSENDAVFSGNDKKLFKAVAHPTEKSDLILIEPMRVVHEAREKILLVSAQISKEELIGDMSRMAWGPVQGLVIDVSQLVEKTDSSLAGITKVIWKGQEEAIRDFAQLMSSTPDLKKALSNPTKAISRVFSHSKEASNILVSWATIPIVGTETNLITLTFANQNAVLAAFWPKKIQLAFFVFVVMGFGLIAAFLMASRMSRPIEEIVSAASILEKGNFQVRVKENRSDELGDLATAFNHMGANLEQRELELQAANTALIQSEKMAALGTISAGLAHEVKNPLAGILGHADMTSAEIKKTEIPNQDVILRHIATIQKETKRCRGIIDNLMKFSRKDAVDKTGAALEPMDVEICAWEAIALNEHPLNLAKVKIEKYFSKKMFMIQGNNNQIEQVLLNMMQNAGHAMPGGGLIRIGTEMFEDVHQAPLGNLPVINPPDFKGPFVRIFVSDTGEGMSLDVQKKIFEPFFTTKPKGVGTGLGLSVTMQILNEHKARLSLTSEPGKGTTFFMDFPALKERSDEVLKTLEEIKHHRAGGEKLSTDITNIGSGLKKDSTATGRAQSASEAIQTPDSAREEPGASVKSKDQFSHFGDDDGFTLSGVKFVPPSTPQLTRSSAQEDLNKSRRSLGAFVVPKPKVKR